MMDKLKFRSNAELEFKKQGFKGNIVINGRYCNGVFRDVPPLGAVLKWKFSSNPQKQERKKDNFRLSVFNGFHFRLNKEDVIVWLGHSSFYLRINGVTIVTDPSFSSVSLIKRRIKFPRSIVDLGRIDHVLISHGHFDHLNMSSLKAVVKANPGVNILGPLGLKSVVRGRKFRRAKVQEAGWYQIYNTVDNVEITFLPARHWSRRGLFDFNRMLWGGFGISIGGFKAYFAGDTAKDIDFFNEIRTLYGGFDVCFLPIGAYNPGYLMSASHMNPVEALGAFKILNGKYLIPMHYGTYDLSDEPVGEPLRLLKEKAATTRLTGTILDPNIGEPINIDDLRHDRNKVSKGRIHNMKAYLSHSK